MEDYSSKNFPQGIGIKPLEILALLKEEPLFETPFGKRQSWENQRPGVGDIWALFKAL